MSQQRPAGASRRIERSVALLAPMLPLAITLLGAAPVLPVRTEWLITAPALLAVLLLLCKRPPSRTGGAPSAQGPHLACGIER